MGSKGKEAVASVVRILWTIFEVAVSKKQNKNKTKKEGGGETLLL